jgi:hypothetical protein
MTLCGWMGLVPLTVVLCGSCGTTGRECTAFDQAGGNGGEAGEEHSGGRLCAPGCSVFCGTARECSRSSGGEGGNAP